MKKIFLFLLATIQLHNALASNQQNIDFDPSTIADDFDPFISTSALDIDFNTTSIPAPSPFAATSEFQSLGTLSPSQDPIDIDDQDSIDDNG